MSRLTFFLFSWHYQIPKFYYQGCPLLGPPFSKSYNIIVSSLVSFYDGSPTQAKVCHISNKCSIKHHVNTSPIWCKSSYEHLLINLCYHTYIHNTLQDTITIIILKNGTHVQKEVSHLFTFTFDNESIFLSTRTTFGA